MGGLRFTNRGILYTGVYITSSAEYVGKGVEEGLEEGLRGWVEEGLVKEGVGEGLEEEVGGGGVEGEVVADGGGWWRMGAGGCDFMVSR